MIILLFFLFFIGFYSMYNTSKKAKLNSYKLDTWLQKHPKTSHSFGIIFFAIAFILSVQFYGVGAGVFVAVILLMTIGSLIVVLSPYLLKQHPNARK